MGAAQCSDLPPDSSEYDLLHAGLSQGSGETFRTLPLTNVSWRFIDPPADKRCTSWKATPSACLIRPESLRALGGFDWSYKSAEARLMDFAFRLYLLGGRVAHDPRLAPAGFSSAQSHISLEDEFLFIRRHVHRFGVAYASCWLALQEGPFRELAIARQRAAAMAASAPPSPKADFREKLRLVSLTRRQTVTDISAIIPTIGRYEYIGRSIDSLRRQNPRPKEIIVVDQTPLSQRRPDVYQPYAGTEVRVIYLDEAGQSSSRNRAIQEATCEWCLLFEDDAEAWEDCLEQHVNLLETTGADASTGVSLAPWKTREYIPQAIRHFHLSDILATGNCLVRRDALLDVGGLDTAFDRGSGADHDLGARLYLNGYEIVFNHKAIETHHKAPAGGMRTHGAWWRNQTTVWAPYPPPTQIYTIRKYYARRYWAPLYLHFFLQARGRNHGAQLAWIWLSAPWKLWRAIKVASKLHSSVLPSRPQTTASR
jgi:GT2 family glycosyltransferase